MPTQKSSADRFKLCLSNFLRKLANWIHSPCPSPTIIPQEEIPVLFELPIRVTGVVGRVNRSLGFWDFCTLKSLGPNKENTDKQFSRSYLENHLTKVAVYSDEIRLTLKGVNSECANGRVVIGEVKHKGDFDISVPIRVTQIGNFAFSKCKNLTCVTIETPIEIGSYAFYQCENLTTVICKKTVTLNMCVFEECAKLTSFKVHDGNLCFVWPPFVFGRKTEPEVKSLLKISHEKIKWKLERENFPQLEDKIFKIRSSDFGSKWNWYYQSPATVKNRNEPDKNRKLANDIYKKFIEELRDDNVLHRDCLVGLEVDNDFEKVVSFRLLTFGDVDSSCREDWVKGLYAGEILCVEHNGTFTLKK